MLGEHRVECLYIQYGPMVLRRCRNMLGNEDAAMDAMQDTFVYLLRYRRRLNDEASSSLLYRMATNVCLNRLRSRARTNDCQCSDVLQQIADARVPEHQLMAANMASSLFHRHPETTKTIAVLHYLDGMTLQQVADEVGMSVSGVRKRLRPLRVQLAEIDSTPLEVEWGERYGHPGVL